MSDEAWIEQSLARLEELETHKAQLEAAGTDPAKLAEIEVEIEALYEALNAVAEAGEDPAADTGADAASVDTDAGVNLGDLSPSLPAAAPMATGPSDAAAADNPFAAQTPATNNPLSAAPPAAAAPSDNPFGAAAPAANPLAAAPAPGFGSDDVTEDPLGVEPGVGSFGGGAPLDAEAAPLGGSDFGDLDDDMPKKSKMPLLATAAAVLLAAGVGGFFVMQKKSEPAQAAAPVAAGEPKVITASAVPEDTQEPDAAKGLEGVQRTEGKEIKEAPAAAPSRPESRAKKSSSKKRRHRARRNRRHKKDDGRKVRSAASNDPLAGL